MSESTPSLGLPFISAAQAQKHVTHNDALLGLDALVQLSVLSRAVADPPASPQEGDRYLVAASATGDWTGMEDTFAAFQDGTWRHYSPMPGWRVWIDDDARFLVYDGTQWRGILADDDVQNLALLGINATADATNKLAVKSAAVLFDNVGAGSQVKVNKAAAGDTASHLFQTGFSGRAEFGLTGDDDFHAKVSPDGSTWYEGILIDKDTGNVTFPVGVGETGTFTPAATFATMGDFSPTHITQLGNYMRIGNLVQFSLMLEFDTNAFTTASGNFRITGLPFTARTDATQFWYPVSGRFSKIDFGGAGRLPIPVIKHGTTFCEVFLLATAAFGNNVGITHVVPSTTNIICQIQGVYRKD